MIDIKNLPPHTGYVWRWLYAKIKNKYGVAGLMGNLYAESGFYSDRLQGDIPHSYKSVEYTRKVDSGEITVYNFIHNGPNGGGYGLAQWTYHTRKEDLYNKWKSNQTKYASIGSIDLALDFLWDELNGLNGVSCSYKGVLSVLKSATSIREASNKVLWDFENPKVKHEEQRAGYGTDIYNLFSDEPPLDSEEPETDYDFIPRLNPNDPDSSKSTIGPYSACSKYWRSRSWVPPVNSGITPGLNYNTAIIDWPDYNVYKDPNAKDEDCAAMYNTGTTLPNCTSWAWGRMYEIMGQQPLLFSGDAGNWWSHFDVKKADFEANGYYKSQQPSLGAIVCWRPTGATTGAGNVGHVAIVEAINKETGTISFSESGWGIFDTRPNYFSVRTNINPADCFYNKAPFYYEFMGYIHLPGTRHRLPTIDTFNLLETGTESVKFDLTISGYDDINTLEISWSINKTETRQLTVSSEKSIITLDNLVPNTKYSIKILISANGTTVESPEISIETLQDYPEQMKKVSIKALDEDLRRASFKVTAEKPDNLGYWHRIGNKSGYRIYTISDCKLLDSFDSDLINTTFIIPPDSTLYGTNLQIGIIPWVKDNTGNPVFALPGEEFPVCSNSIYLKNIDEVSDTLFLLLNNKINRLSPYIKQNNTIIQ